jgi:hypothetical protein
MSSHKSEPSSIARWEEWDGCLMADRIDEQSEADADIVDAPNYLEMPFEEGVRVLMEQYGASWDSATEIMAFAHGLTTGCLKPVSTPARKRRRRTPARPR